MALRESEERFRQLTKNLNSVSRMREPQNNQVIYIFPSCKKNWAVTAINYGHHPTFS